MALRWTTPCNEPDINGRHYCPYMDSSGYVNCEYWCHDEEPEDRSMEDEIIYETCEFDNE